MQIVLILSQKTGSIQYVAPYILFSSDVPNPAEVVKYLFLVFEQVLHSAGVLRGQWLGLLPEAAQAYVRERGPLHHHADC